MLTAEEQARVAEIRARLAEEEACWERIREIDKALEWEDSISAVSELERENAELLRRANELHIRNAGGCDDDAAFLLALVQRLAGDGEGA